MKTTIASLLAATLSAFAFAPAASAATDKTPSGFSVREVIRFDNTEIGRGTPRMTVRRLMGAAQRQLSPDVWVYEGFSPKSDLVTPGHGCHQLIITFTGNTVSDLKIVNDSAVRVIAANLRTVKSDIQIAKKK
jgi:hypothetical protein